MARRVLHDQYFRRAKEEGYLARSAYKLEQIQEKKRLLRPGDLVLDLGCAPGAWLQVASRIVGSRGRVLGLDLQDVRAEIAPNVRTLRGDVHTASALDLRRAAAQGSPAGAPAQDPPRFDVVLSDMAPSTTGHGDHFLSVRLCRRVLDLLPDLLRPGGALAMKVFEGEEYPVLLRETARLFDRSGGFKPPASREVSREMYLIGAGFRAGPRPAP